MDNVFVRHAKAYFDAGMSVIPLRYRDKRPFFEGWQEFAAKLPTPEQQAQWLDMYTDCNMGLVLGPQSRVCVIDIDTEDPELIELIESLIPESPWKRVGKKGAVYAYKYTGHKTFRIKTEQGLSLVELLSTGTQVVLPPSIHPETQRAYEANCNLWEVIDQLPELDPQIEELMRGGLRAAGQKLSLTGSAKLTDWVPVGQRDVKMTSLAGLFAHSVLRGERSLLEAIEQMRVWHSTFMEQVAGDDVDVEKGVQNLVKFLVRDVVERDKILPKGWDKGLSEEDRAQLGLNFTADQQEWDYQEIKDRLLELFQETNEQSPERTKGVEEILKRMAVSQQLSGLEIDQICNYIKSVNKFLNVSAMKRRIKEFQQGSVAGKDHTEIAKAVIADLEEVTPIRYWREQIMSWNGSHWQVKPEQEILQIIADRYGHLEAAKRASDHKGIMMVVKQLIGQRIGSVEQPGVNFANGVLNEAGQLLEHEMDYGFTYTLPFRYTPGAPIPKFMDFLEQCWGEEPDFEDRLKCLQECICATIFGIAPQFQKAFLLFGPGGTGKSQLLDIVSALVPDEGRCSVPPHAWANTFDTSSFVGKVLNVAGETSEKDMIKADIFKRVVAGEEIEVQFKYKNPIRIRPTVANWFAGNHLPRTHDTSRGFTRRWQIFTFHKVFDRLGVRIPNLGEKIAIEEREGIVAWAVEAMPRLREQREYTQPASHIEIVKEVANLNNTVRFFIQESGLVRVDPDDGENGSKTQAPCSENSIYNAYSSFCYSVGGVRPVGQQKFRRMMEELAPELGFRRKTGKSSSGILENVYPGLTLVPVKAA